METSYNCARWFSATVYQKVNSSIVSKGVINSFNEMFPLARMFTLAVMHTPSPFHPQPSNFGQNPLSPPNPVIHWKSITGLQRIPRPLMIFRNLLQNFNNKINVIIRQLFRSLKHRIFTGLISMIKLTGKRMHFTLANFHKKLPQLLCPHYSFKFQGSSFKFQTSFKEAV